MIWLGLVYWVVAPYWGLASGRLVHCCFHQLGENPLYYQHIAPMYAGGTRVYSWHATPQGER